MMTINQCQIVRLPIYCSLMALALVGQFAKDRIAPTIETPSQGMSASSDSAPLKPARVQIRQSGTTTRASAMIAPKSSIVLPLWMKHLTLELRGGFGAAKDVPLE